jgi:hypothetical protein
MRVHPTYQLVDGLDTQFRHDFSGFFGDKQVKVSFPNAQVYLQNDHAG